MKPQSHNDRNRTGNDSHQCIWLTQAQIADLFGVFVSVVSANIRAILKNGILDEDRVFRRMRT